MKSSYDFDTAIVGGGCIGSSIAYELTRRGFRNTVVLDNGRSHVSATANSGGMLRVFHENPEHIELALNNLDLLKHYQSIGVISEKNRCNGSLYFFDQRRYRDYEKNLQKIETRGYPFQILTPQNGRMRFPQFQWSPNQWAVYEPQSTHLSPLRFSDDLLKSSQSAGLTLKNNFEVERISYFRDRYRLFSNDSVVTAKTIILAGGARILPHLKELGIAHSLKSQTLKAYKIPKCNEDVELPNFFDRENLEYGRLGPGSDVVLSNPTTQRFIKNYWQINRVESISAEDCYSPNRLGFAGFLLGHPRLILATGWGGTAFKFALEIGHRVGQALETDLNERSTHHANQYI